MTNDALLEKFGKLLDTKLEAEREHTKKLVHEEVEAAKQEIIKIIEKDTEDMAEFFHKTWEKMDETNERVTTFEDHLGLPHPKEN